MTADRKMQFPFTNQDEILYWETRYLKDEDKVDDHWVGSVTTWQITEKGVSNSKSKPEIASDILSHRCIIRNAHTRR